jgi:guanylate kinase
VLDKNRENTCFFSIISNKNNEIMMHIFHLLPSKKKFRTRIKRKDQTSGKKCRRQFENARKSKTIFLEISKNSPKF